MKPTFDERDYRIAAMLAVDAWLTYVELSLEVNLSASAVQRRVERMIDKGVILGAHAEVSFPDRAGPVTIFVLLEIVDESRAGLDRFAATVGSQPAVVEAHYVAGETDVLLKLDVPDMKAYDRFIDEHIGSSTMIRRFRTLTVLRTLGAKGRSSRRNSSSSR